MNTQEFKRRITAILSADVEGYSRMTHGSEPRMTRMCRLLGFLLAIVFCVQTSCAPVRPVSLAQPDRRHLGRVAVVAARFDPDYQFEALTAGKGDAAVKGALIGALTCGQILKGSGNVISALLFAACLPVGATVGAIAGASHAAPAQQIDEASAAVQRGIAALDLQWGNDEFGQLQALAGPFTALGVGVFHTCAIRDDGTLACWGRDDVGQATPPTGNFIALASAGLHSCAVATDGSIECWGDDTVGQATPPDGTFTLVAVGASHSCGLRDDGSVECWGADDLGQASPPAGTFTQISARNANTCGIRNDGDVECWGNLTDTAPTCPVVLYGNGTNFPSFFISSSIIRIFSRINTSGKF